MPIKRVEIVPRMLCETKADHDAYNEKVEGLRSNLMNLLSDNIHLKDILCEYTELTREEGELDIWSGPCVHDTDEGDDCPGTLRIGKDGNVYYCDTCKYGGNLFSFINRAHKFYSLDNATFYLARYLIEKLLDKKSST